MRAERITRDALHYLEANQGRRLSVHSVFEHAINLIDQNNHLLAILDSSKDQGPISLQLAFDHRLAAVLPGELTRIRPEGVEFLRGGWLIEVAAIPPDNLTMGLRKLCPSNAELQRRFCQLRQLIIDEGSPDGLAPLIDQTLPQNNYTGFMANNLSELIGWIEQGEVDKLRNGLSGIIGFGPGLTPSTDDFLVGLMLVAGILRKHRPDPVFEVLLHDLPRIARAKTTRISEEMIRLAALGKTSHSYKAFLSGLLGTRPTNLKQLARQVIATGATSGTDFLYGVYVSQVMIPSELQGGTDAKSPSQAQ